MDKSIVEYKIKPGVGYENPKDGNEVEISVVGKTMDGKEFDPLRTITFEIGDGRSVNVCEGIEIALKKMKKLQSSKLDIMPKYTSGITIIPQNTPVQYNVTLNSFEKFKDSWNLESAEEKLKYTEDFKVRGTERFKLNKYCLALVFYDKALSYIDADYDFKSAESTIQDQRKSLLLALHLNKSLCYLKTEDTHQCLQSCEKALEINPQSDKALFRQGQAYILNEDYSSAKASFQKVLDIDPKNSAAKQQIQICGQKIREIVSKEKALYKNIFDKMAKQSQHEAEKKSGDIKSENKQNGNHKEVSENDKSESSMESAEVSV